MVQNVFLSGGEQKHPTLVICLATALGDAWRLQLTARLLEETETFPIHFSVTSLQVHMES